MAEARAIHDVFGGETQLSVSSTKVNQDETPSTESISTAHTLSTHTLITKHAVHTKHNQSTAQPMSYGFSDTQYNVPN